MRSISGMVAEGDRHQAGLFCVRASLARALEDAIGRKSANRQVVIAGPAEAAEIGTATDDLDEEARPELCVGREDAGAGRVECLRRGDGGFSHRGRRAGAFLWNESIDRAVCSVFDVVKRRDVEPAPLRERLQQLAPSALFAERAHQPRHQLFTFACRDHVGEHGQRLRVDERDGPAYHDQRIAGGSVGRSHLHTRKAEHRQDVRVIPFERDRERDDVEVARQRLRLERHQRRPGGQLLFQLLFRRKKDALAHDVVVRVEELINRLKAEIRHPNPVRVGKCEGHAKAIGVGLSDIPHFLCQRCLCGFFLLPGVH